MDTLFLTILCTIAPNEPGYYDNRNERDYYTIAKFSETNYHLELRWDNPPKMKSFEELVLLYPNIIDFLASESNVSDAVILAHVEVLYIGSNCTSSQENATKIPTVTLTGPSLSKSKDGISLNTTENQLDFILRNSSKYGLEYCYDGLQERVVGYIPITVTVISPQQYSLLANHSFSLNMTLSSPNDTVLNDKLRNAYDTFNLTIFITPG